MKRKTVKRTSNWIVVRWMLILRPAIVTATLGMAIIWLPDEVIDKTTLAIVVFGTYLLTLLYWISHNLFGTSRPLLAIQISFDIFLITAIIIIVNYSTGTYDPYFTGFYFLSIMCASLFFKRIVTFLFSLQSILFFVLSLFVIGPYLDPFFIPEDKRSSFMLQAFMFSALMLGVGFFSSYYAERVFKKDSALIRALRLLRKARLDTSDILQSMTTGLLTIDTSGLIMYMNRAARSILRIDNTIVEGKDYHTIFGKQSPELVKVLESSMRQRNVSSEKEIEVFDRNGSTIPIGLTMVPLYDTDGSSRGLIVNFKDLTEKNKLIEMVRQADRMAAIGELSASIAHELKNPLASICSAVELLAETVDSQDEQTSKLIGIIERESARLERISSDFLQFARIQTPNIKPIELRPLIDDVLVLIENDPRKTEHIAIINKIDKDIHVLFDEDHLRQIVLNLLINSLEALDGEGEIELMVEKDRYIGNRYVRFLIRDNGPGFPDDAHGKMFEPFFSTKRDGTGLGLAIVRKMAISNNGRIFAQNRAVGGAEIVLDILVKGDD